MQSKGTTYESTVMLRMTAEFTERLDKAVVAMAKKERGQGRARKVGRATIVHEAMKIGLPLLEEALKIRRNSESHDETGS